MPDDETLPCGDLWEEISQDDPREGNTRSDPHREDGAVRLSSRPAGRNQEKAHQVFPPTPHFSIREGMAWEEGGGKASSCLPNLFIEQGYFLLFKVVYHSIKVAIRLSHIVYSTDSSVSGCNPGCCARVFSGTDRSRF